MNIEDNLELADNNRQKCSICGRTIPKNVHRVSFYYNTQWGGSNKRICGMCILELAEHIDKESIKEWKNKIMVKRI